MDQIMGGNVFSMTNEAPGNRIVMFYRDQDGSLAPLGTYETGGSGTGAAVVDPLTSQGSVVVSQDRRFLFCVNAGSNDITSFRIGERGLDLVDVIPSGGTMPNALATHGSTLYVTNLGSDTIPSSTAAYQIADDGHLYQLPGSVQGLSAADAKPSCITVSPDGDLIVISERTTNQLTSYRALASGIPANPVTQESSGAAPFGSAFAGEGLLLVSEAGPNAVSSYSTAQRPMRVISPSVPNGQMATCWLAVTPNRRHAYTTDAGTGMISRYDVGENGTVTLVSNTPSISGGGGAPIDCAIDSTGTYFYALNGNQGSISAFRIEADGDLSYLGVTTQTGLPQTGAQGLAVY